MDRRDFLRVALAGGAAALIPKALMAAAPDAVGSTTIFVEGIQKGHILSVTDAGTGRLLYSVRFDVAKPPEGKHEIDAPLKWGEIRVHLIQRTEGKLSIVGPDDRPMGVQIITSRTTEIAHDRMPDGEKAKRKNMISINGVATELDDKWDIVMPDDPLTLDGETHLFADPKHLLPPGASFTGVKFSTPRR